MAKLIHTHKGTVYAQRNGVLIPVNTDGLVGYWPMTQGSGSTVYDESKNGNNGTLNNGPVWTDTANGKALDFDGVDDYVEVPSNIHPETTNSLTWATWMKLDTVSIIHDLIQYGPNNFESWAEVLDTAQVRFGLKNQAGTREYFDSSQTISADTWTFLAFVWDGSTMNIYIDGNKDSNSGSLSGELKESSSTIIGRAYSSSEGKWFNGTIDEVRVYNRALSAQEITNIYEKTRGLYGI